MFQPVQIIISKAEEFYSETAAWLLTVVNHAIAICTDSG